MTRRHRHPLLLLLSRSLLPCTAALLTTVWVCCPSADGAEWPAYKRDASRSSHTVEELPLPLAQSWVYHPGSPPRPAWPEPGKELNRVDFDVAFQPVVAANRVYFGSSSDDTLRALDADTGKLAWRFSTGGPIRFAPAIVRNKAYVVSDDGSLYCLNAQSGEMLWRFQAAPTGDKVIGNGRLISRWPCRSGVLVVEDTVYVAAGMWPTEGIYVYAIDADTGKERWCNDSSGNIYIDLPHAVASGFSGVAPQGYLVVCGDTLLVPTGRSIPAAFDRHTGRLLYYKPEKTHYHGAAYGGGVWCTAAGELYFNTNNRFHNPSEPHIGEADPCPQDGMIGYSVASGDQQCHLAGKYRVLATGDVLYMAGLGSVDAVNLSVLRQKRRVGAKDLNWTTPHQARVYCMALAGQTLLTGNRDGIRAFDATNGKPVWEAELKGLQVRGMAIASGRLIAATNAGTLLCFGSKTVTGSPTRQVKEEPRPPTVSEKLQRRSKELLTRVGKTEGYGLVVGEPDSQLAESLARQTQLKLICAIRGSSSLPVERQRLLNAGSLGARVTLHGVEDPEHSDLPSYFADLVVVCGNAEGISAAECYRSLRPCGGVLCLVGFDASARKDFYREAGIPEKEVDASGSLVIRGKLPGAGDWPCAWADGGRSGIGQESRARFPMQLLWFGGPGPGRLVDRHLMGSPPVSVNGRVFMQGVHHVIAFDAYNGRELWSRQIDEVGRKYAQYYSSSLVADDESVYVVQADKCHRLDQATGKTVSVYPVPKSVIDQVEPPVVPEYLDVRWPQTWQVLGPFPKGKRPLARTALQTIPERLTVGGQEYVATELRAVDDVIDFTTLFGGYGLKPLPAGRKPAAHPRRGKRFSFHDVGRLCYAFAKIDCPRAGKLLIGAGADWGMQWFLDGVLVFDAARLDGTSSRRGFFNREPCSPKERIFDVDVTAGEHVLAVIVNAGSRGWALASASMARQAQELMPVADGSNPNVPDLTNLIWGYVSVADDLLLGSYNVPVTAGQEAESHLLWRSESKALFAIDKNSGSVRWVYRPKPGRIVANIEIAFGDGRLFLVDGTSKADLVRAKRRQRKIEADLELVALNLADGSEQWRQKNVPLLGDRDTPSRLNSNITHLFMGQPSWGHLVYANGVVVYGANAAYDATTGYKLWQKPIRPGKLPIVHGDQIITASTAYDLRTGKQRMTEDAQTGQRVPWSYHHAYGCGPVMGCQSMLFFRSGAAGFFDLYTEGTTNFGGVRSGCARTLLAANGLLLHPLGYSGCCCSYNFKTNLALISAPESAETWYVFPRRASKGPIKQIAINLGAPGDRKDANSKPWLGFPRPIQSDACPAPVTLSMSDASVFHRRRASATIQGTDTPWLYSSGLYGSGSIAIDTALQPDIVMHQQDIAPAIDGDLSDRCWKDVRTIPFESTAFSLLGASVDLRLFRDDESLYFAYHRKPLAHAYTDTDQASLANNDKLAIYLSDGRRVGILMEIGRGGGATASLGTIGVSRKTDPKWKCAWQYAVQELPGGWAAEVAVPIKTLTQAGLSLKRLQLNCMSQNLTQAGLEGVFLTDPYYSVKFRCCCRFRNLVAPRAEPPAERTFTVRLHFAELDDVNAGQRRFDVLLQGSPVLKDLDVVKQAKGRNIALVKELTGIRAAGQVLIELKPHDSGSRRSLLPMLNAVEVVQEAERE